MLAGELATNTSAAARKRKFSDEACKTHEGFVEQVRPGNAERLVDFYA